jgi:large subunit ribosomal protein L31
LHPECGIQQPFTQAADSGTILLSQLGDRLALVRTISVVNDMKENTHPEYFVTTVKCGCGNSFTTRSTRPELKVDICNVCHPFYTGKLKFVDTAGRIEKFKNKFASAGYASLKRGKKSAEKGESAEAKAES